MITYRKSENFILRKIAGSHVLISVGNNIANLDGYIQLNETAYFLWERLTVPCTKEELTAALENEFSIDHDTAEKELTDLLIKMEQNNMVIVDE